MGRMMNSRPCKTKQTLEDVMTNMDRDAVVKECFRFLSRLEKVVAADALYMYLAVYKVSLTYIKLFYEKVGFIINYFVPIYLRYMTEIK